MISGIRIFATSCRKFRLDGFSSDNEPQCVPLTCGRGTWPSSSEARSAGKPRKEVSHSCHPAASSGVSTRCQVPHPRPPLLIGHHQRSARPNVPLSIGLRFGIAGWNWRSATERQVGEGPECAGVVFECHSFLLGGFMQGVGTVWMVEHIAELAPDCSSQVAR